MLNTEDFSMRHYVGFSQIGSQMIKVSFTRVTTSTKIVNMKEAS